MNGPDFVADTNVPVYIMEGNKRVAQFVDFKFAVSVISEIELLGRPGIKPVEINVIRNLFRNCLVTELTPQIRTLPLTLSKIIK